MESPDIYYSFWTNGWRQINQNLDLWSLSFSLAKRAYPKSKMYLVTDSKGAEILRGLPFDKVFILLDEFHIFKKIWSLGKIIAYKKAASESNFFLHLDADVFLWEKLPEDLIKSKIFAQSFDVARRHKDSLGNSAYDIEHIIREYGCAPELWEENINSNEMMINMGIFGGKDLEIINEYCDLALEMILDKKFYDLWAGKNLGEKVKTCLPCMMEQMNLALFLKKKNIKIKLLFENLGDCPPTKYTHLMDLKSNQNILEKIKNRVKDKNYSPSIVKLILMSSCLGIV